jgi:hypothetical protein
MIADRFCKNSDARTELATRIMKYRSLMRRVIHDETKIRLLAQIIDLERQLRKTDLF